MKKILASCFGIMGLASIVLLGMHSSAYAGSCTSTTTPCTFDLTNSNISNLGPIDVRVTWDNSGTNTTLSVQWISGGPGTPGFINEFAFNLSQTVATVTSVSYNGNNVTSLWTLNQNGTSVDGFGSFPSDEQNGPTAAAQREGIAHPIVFTLSTQITSIPTNGNGAEFVAHVGGYSSGCSAFVSDGTDTGAAPQDNCSPVPEPATVLLVGTLLSGLGFFGRKKFIDTLKG